LIAYLKLFRFPLVFTAIADSAAGYLLAQTGRRDPLDLLLIAAASSGLYFFGMALNDIADFERDRVIAPQRVLPSGRITRRSALAAANIAAIFSGLCVVLVQDAPVQRFLVWGGVLFCIVIYDVFLKIPPVMGLVRAGNFLLGVFCASAGREAERLVTFTYTPYLLLAAVPFVYVTALTFVSTLEEGTVRRPVVLVGAMNMAAAAFVPLILRSAWYFHRVLWALIPAVLLTSWILVRAARAADRKGVMLLVRDGIAGIILLEATQLTAAGRILSAAAVATLLLPVAVSVAWFKKLA
jgi:4-hydroxybenzoate polyprenyltransferase